MEEEEVDGTCSMKGGVHRTLVGTPEGKRRLEKPRRKWKNSIKMDLKINGLGGHGLIHVAQERDWWRAVVNTAVNCKFIKPRKCVYDKDSSVTSHCCYMFRHVCVTLTHQFETR
jgi:hypothetical protein